MKYICTKPRAWLFLVWYRLTHPPEFAWVWNGELQERNERFDGMQLLPIHFSMQFNCPLQCSSVSCSGFTSLVLDFWWLSCSYKRSTRTSTDLISKKIASKWNMKPIIKLEIELNTKLVLVAPNNWNTTINAHRVEEINSNGILPIETSSAHLAKHDKNNLNRYRVSNYQTG